jgi:uncharacterized membrane protein YphA (DoxX/SURF4 family)
VLVSDILLSGRWVLAIVLFAAGAAKLIPQRRSEFAAAVGEYGVLPSLLVKPVTRLLPWFEMTLALVLAVGVLLPIAAAAAALILGVFAFAVGGNLLRGRRFDCGCGTGAHISWALVGRDGMLCSLAVAVATGRSGGLAIWPGWTAQPVSASWQSQLPVALVTVLAVSAIRLLAVSRPVFPRPSAPPLARQSL